MKRKGFTLLELLIVIIILGILAAIALPRYFANVENARGAEAQTTLNALREADLALFATTGGHFAGAPAPSWAVDVDSDGTNDITVTPNPTRFTYTIGVAGATPNYPTRCLQAAPTEAGGTVTYSMCVLSGRFANTVCPPSATACP